MDLAPQDINRHLSDDEFLRALARGITVITNNGLRIFYRGHPGELIINNEVYYSASWLDLTNILDER